jgi:PAS domain S-box-containing protein
MALCFLMLAVALMGLNRARLFRFGQRCAVAAGFVGVFNVVAYAYSVQSLEFTKGLTSYTEMALHTAGTLVVLSVGITAARPGRGATGIFVEDTAGGTLARRLLPVALFGPVILGAVRLWGEREGYYGFEFGVTLMAVSNLSMFSALGWWVAVRLHLTDIERLRAQEELRDLNEILEGQVRLRTAELTASEARYRHLTEQSAEGIVIHQGGIMRLVNHAAMRMLGYDGPYDAEGQPITRHLPSDLREAILARIDARLRGESVPATNEMEVLRQDGSRFWIETTAAVVEWQGASATRVALIDVTERRRAEEALREREIQLRSSATICPTEPSTRLSADWTARTTFPT